LRDVTVEALDRSDISAASVLPVHANMKHIFGKRLPSKFDHFHEKTFISTHVPVVEANHFTNWQRNGIKYMVPEPEGKAERLRRSTNGFNSTSRAGRRTNSSRWSNVKSMINDPSKK
jgi:hypothetical protein